MFLCYFDNVNYFSPSKVESLWETYEIKSGKKLRKRLAYVYQVIKQLTKKI